MIKFPIALQLYSIRDDIKADFLGALRKVKALGYDGVELAGLHGYSAEEVREMCKEVGLNPISAHVGYLDIMENPGLLQEYKDIGCEFVVVPSLREEYRPGKPQFFDFIEDMKEIVKKADEVGVKLCYHNHDFDFVKIEGGYGIDVLYKEVPTLMPELDCCWVKVSGESPVEYIHKYAGREEILHLKDFVGRKTENMYGLIGIDEDENKDTKGEFEFRPLGCGVQDFPSILKAAEEVGMRWVVVEQDRPSMDKTPMECAETSINYLKSL